MFNEPGLALSFPSLLFLFSFFPFFGYIYIFIFVRHDDELRSAGFGSLYGVYFLFYVYMYIILINNDARAAQIFPMSLTLKQRMLYLLCRRRDVYNSNTYIEYRVLAGAKIPRRRVLPRGKCRSDALALFAQPPPFKCSLARDKSCCQTSWPADDHFLPFINFKNIFLILRTPIFRHLSVAASPLTWLTVLLVCDRPVSSARRSRRSYYSFSHSFILRTFCAQL